MLGKVLFCNLLDHGGGPYKSLKGKGRDSMYVCSAWNVLLVVLIGMAGLVVGWAMECWHLQHQIPSWLQISTIAPLQGVLRFCFQPNVTKPH